MPTSLASRLSVVVVLVLVAQGCVCGSSGTDESNERDTFPPYNPGLAPRPPAPRAWTPDEQRWIAQLTAVVK